MIPTTDEAIRMLMKLSVLKKYGDLIEKNTTRAPSTTISAADSGTPREDRAGPAARPAAPGASAGGAAATASARPSSAAS